METKQTVTDFEYYTCITGEKIKRYPDTRIFVYDKILLVPLLTDIITQKYIRYPILFNDNIYDEHTLQRWLRTSNIDPLTGLTVASQTISFTKISHIAVYSSMLGRKQGR